MSNINDFEIKDGKLLGYNGEDEEIIIPDGVTSIGDGAFYRCSSLTSIKIPDSVTSIGEHAFDGCTSLESVTIPDSVTSIGYGTFEGCNSLKSVTLSNRPTKIGDHMFEGCRNLETITIPDSVTVIRWSAFEDCSNLEVVTIPSNVTRIMQWAFKGCSGLKVVTIPGSVTSIDRWAFEDCCSLESILIPTSVTSIGEGAFHDSTVVIMKNYIKGIEKEDLSKRLVFQETPIEDIKSTNAKRLAVNGFLTVADLSVYSDDVIESYKRYLKGKVVNYRDVILESDTEMIVGRLASLELLDNKLIDKMLEYDLADGVKSILLENGKKQQKKSSGTVSKKKGPSVTELKKTWGYKKNEEGITITSYKGVDTDVVVPEMIGKDNVTEIGAEAFSANKRGINEFQKDARKKIMTVTIPNGVTNIGKAVFDGCSSLTSITIPDSVTSIEMAVFRDCSSLTNITIPDSVTTIERCSFQWCKSLTNITIPDSVTGVRMWAFEGCSDLTIHANSGSYAEKYAKENEIPFKAL